MKKVRRPIDPPPFAGNLILSTYPGMTLSGALPADHLVGNPLHFAVVAAPIHGAVVVVDPTAGRFTYTASGRGIGSDSFIFTATDTVTGHVSNLGMVTVIVAESPDPL
ncbi:MAG TPA: Ig-like domain-containing protein [Gammaproteobacteria bacterium]|nr:Ig-like domain-containing protein [Gammaproteobacteria bacterium]